MAHVNFVHNIPFFSIFLAMFYGLPAKFMGRWYLL